MTSRRCCALLLLAWIPAMLAWSQPDARKAALQSEVFLLAPNLHYTYEYYHSESFSDELTSSSSADSGVVEYVVVDSVQVNDTTTRWQLRQYSMLVHRETASVCPCETTYATADSVTILLFEHTFGMHALECSGIAWELPVWPGADPVNRYADSSEVIIVRDLSGPTGSAFDSVRLSSASGLSFRESASRSSSGFIQSSRVTRFRLRTAPSAAAPADPAVPMRLELSQNYPNPFDPLTSIAYSVAREGYVSLAVYDLLGREVASLVHEPKQPGRYSAAWNAAGMTSGIYFYRLRAGAYGETKKMILTR